MDPEGKYERRQSIKSIKSLASDVPPDPEEGSAVAQETIFAVADTKLPAKPRVRQDTYDGPTAPPLEDMDDVSLSTIERTREPSQTVRQKLIRDAPPESETIRSSIAIPIGLNSTDADLPEARVIPIITHAVEGNADQGFEWRNLVERRNSAEDAEDEGVSTCNLLRHPQLFRELVNNLPDNDEDDDEDDEDNEEGRIASRCLRHPQFFRELVNQRPLSCEASSHSSSDMSKRWRDFGITDTDEDEGSSAGEDRTSPPSHRSNLGKSPTRAQETKSNDTERGVGGDGAGKKKEGACRNSSYHRYQSLYSM